MSTAPVAAGPDNASSNSEERDGCPNHNSQVALWVPNDLETQCFRCPVRFGFFIRKHHCRNCGNIVCSTCS